MKYVVAILMLLILIVGCAPSGNTVTSQPQTPVSVDNQSAQVPPDSTMTVQQPTPQPPETAPQPAIPPKVLKITYLAHSCFLITSSDGLKVITDPYNVIGYAPINESADIVTISHEDWDHSNVAGVTGQPEVVRAPGTTTVKGVEFKIIEAWHDAGKTKPNNIVCFTVDGVNFCFLGDLGSTLTPEQISAIGSMDVLFVPVGGGGYTINAKRATETYSAINPAIVIPMHYGTQKLAFSLDGINDFLLEKSNVKKLNSSLLEISKAELPKSTTIVVMDPAR